MEFRLVRRTKSFFETPNGEANAMSLVNLENHKDIYWGNSIHIHWPVHIRYEKGVKKWVIYSNIERIEVKDTVLNVYTKK